MNLLLSALCLLITTALAQTGPQATLLPACIKTCDPPAIVSVNCTNADQYCHCARQTGILSNITACADKECANPSGNLYTFTTLFGEVCQQFNITVPVLGSNSSANGTLVTPPSSSPSVVGYTGSADRLTAIRSEVLLSGGLAALVVAAML